MNTPLISAVVPAYNHEQFIGDALRSLIAQTYPALELIVIDDGSTDATYTRIKEFEPELLRRFRRVEIGTKRNEGSARTIARCLELARGELVYMLDSDDVAHPQAIARLLPKMTAPEVALVVGDNDFIDSNGAAAERCRDGICYSTLLSYCTGSRAGFSVERDFGSYASLIEGNYIPNGWLLRRRCVDEVGGYPPGVTLDDWSLLLRLAKEYAIRFAGSILGRYRIHERNTMSVLHDAVLVDSAALLLRERTYCRQHGLEAPWSRHASRVFAELTPDQISHLITHHLVDDHSWDDKGAWVEALARLGRLEHGVARVRGEHERATRDLLAAHRADREQLSLEHERATQDLLVAHRADREQLSLEHERTTQALLASVHSQHRAECERIHSTHERATKELITSTEAAHRTEREKLVKDLSATSARLCAVESSRSWRWTRAARAGFGTLSGRRSHRWDVGLDPVTVDSSSLGAVHLTGWAFHNDVTVTNVEISVDGRPPFDVVYGIERPDVVAAFPACNAGPPGFSSSIHVLEDPVALRITLFLADGRTKTAFRVLRRTPDLNDYARACYGAPDRDAMSPIRLLCDLSRYGRIGRYIWQSRRIRGWTRGRGEAEALARTSDGLAGSPVIVEIGAFLGCSTVLLAGPRKQRGSGHVHCVDTFEANGDDSAVPIYRAIADSLGMSMRRAFDRNILHARLSHWVTVHQMSAADAARQWNTPIDMLYLDGDVSIAGSQELYESWSPFLRSGGVLAINGTVERPTRTGSFRVVERFVRSPDYQDIRRVDHITFARKS